MRVAALLLFASSLAAGGCLPVEKAADKIGDTVCVTGKVVKVARGDSGTHFLNFCANYQTCPFAVVVFSRDLRQVGDVRQLEGRMVEVEGTVQLYEGRPEIILRDSRQLKGEAGKLPPVPKSYDVERHGRYSAGKISYPTNKKPRRKHPRRGADSIPVDEGVGRPEPE